MSMAIGLLLDTHQELLPDVPIVDAVREAKESLNLG